MVTWEDGNTQARQSVAAQIREYQALVSPFAESIYPVQSRLQECLDKLAQDSPRLEIGVFGIAGSGKTTLINALLSASSLPVALSGKPCEGEEAGHSELPLVFTEFPGLKRVCESSPSGNDSQYKVTGVRSPCDVYIVCIDYSDLKTEREALAFSVLRDEGGSTTLQGLAERIFVVVTKADPLIAHTNKVPSNRAYVEPKFDTKDECSQYVSNMVTKLIGTRPRPVQLALVSATLALYAKVMRREFATVSIQEMYDFSEMVGGSEHMQTIDDLTEEELREDCRLKAIAAERDSGFSVVETAIQIIDVNSGRMFLSSLLRDALHHCNQHSSLLEQSGPVLSSENAQKQEELRALQDEYDDVAARLQRGVMAILSLRRDTRSLVEMHFHEFWVQQVEGVLRPILFRPDTLSLSSSQSVYDLQAQLTQFDQFLPRYCRDRTYLERRVKQLGKDLPSKAAGKERKSKARLELERAEAELNGEGDEAEGQAAKQEAAAETAGRSKDFVQDFSVDTLKVLEEEKSELILGWCTAVSHFLKDELSAFLPVLEGHLQLLRVGALGERRGEVEPVFDRAVQAHGLADSPTSQSVEPNMEEDMAVELVVQGGISELGHDLRDLNLLIYDDRSLNNFTREISERVCGLMGRLNIAADSVRQREALMTIWIMFMNQVSPYEIAEFAFQPLQETLGQTLNVLNRLVGRYVSKLQSTMAQVEGEIATNTKFAAQNQSQKFSIPVVRESLQDVWTGLISRNIYNSQVASAHQSEFRLGEGE